jgi:hypothetical protein
VNNNVTFGASSHLAIELSGTSADKLMVGGNLDLSSNDFLDVTGSGTGPWVIATYAGTLSGTFDNVTSGYVVDYTTPGQIILNSMSLPGDYNSDGVAGRITSPGAKGRTPTAATRRDSPPGGRTSERHQAAAAIPLAKHRCRSRQA